jgi:hypothetical protein
MRDERGRRGRRKRCTYIQILKKTTFANGAAVDDDVSAFECAACTVFLGWEADEGKDSDTGDEEELS